MSDRPQDSERGAASDAERGGGERAAGGPSTPGPYTVVNLKQVEDMAPRFGLSPSLESRFARVALELRASGLSYFRIAPNVRQPFGHRHSDQEEIYLIVGGSARAKVGDELLELHTWDALRVSPPEIRALEAGPAGAEVIAFGSPSHDNRDVEPIQGWWSD